MRLGMGLLAAAAALWAGEAQAASLEVRGAVARIVVIPEDRSDIVIEVARPNPRLPLTVRRLGDRTVLEGGLDGGRRIRNCHAAGAGSRVEVTGVGIVGWDEMPRVTVRTPRAVHVDADGAVFGAVGRSASLTLGNAGCGDWTVANVEGPARITQAGSGDTRMGSAGALRVNVAGSGDVAAADIRGDLNISIAGAGSGAVRSVSGPLDVSIAGAGDVIVQGGRASDMRVSVAGSGDVDFRGVADSLRVRIAGSGDVRVREVKGQVSKLILGAGSVRLGD